MSDKDFFKETTLPGSGSPSSKESKSSPPQEVPKIIGPYKIESLLEKGGMSLLYLGTHPETKEPITIKVLSPKYLSNPEFTKHFLNEAEIIAMADHPNIVKLFGYGEWEGGLYIAMEFIQGISLRQYILQTPMSLKRAMEIVIDIAYALCHLHTHGVIHRDLKPENILVTESGIIKVIDFGIAQLLTEKSSPEATPKQRLIGTPIYMSPEQRENPESVSYPSDIYSLGIIMYELVLGKLCHGQIHLSLMPKGIQKILTKALQPNPVDRYEDVVDFISDVSAYLNSENLQKEKKVGDLLSEISENLRRTHGVLIPEKAPQWPSIEIAVASQRNLIVSGVYHDFFEIENGIYGIVIAESSAKDAEGFIYMSILRGMVRALARLTTRPADLVTFLNDLLIKDKIEQIFLLSYLVCNPKKKQLQYISCGASSIWYFPAKSQTINKIFVDNIALGIDPEAEFKDLTTTWEVGDSIVIGNLAGMLSNPSQEDEFKEEKFHADLQETIGFPTQRRVDYLLRQVKKMIKPLERTICLISIEHK